VTPKLASAMCVAVLCTPSFAQGQQSPTRGRTQLSVGLQTGKLLEDRYFPPIADVYDAGIAFQAGHTFQPGVYLGAAFDYFFVQDDPGASAQALQAGGVFGYDFSLGTSFALRPELGVGYGRIGVTSASGVSSPRTTLVWLPGLRGTFAASGWFASTGLRLSIFETADDVDGDAVSAGVHASSVLWNLSIGLFI